MSQDNYEDGRRKKRLRRDYRIESGCIVVVIPLGDNRHCLDCNNSFQSEIALVLDLQHIGCISIFLH